MSEWKVLVGRISLFPSQSSPTPSALDVFQKVWGAPDSFKKQGNPLLPTVAQGKQGGIIVNCSTQPGRIDLNLTPAHSTDDLSNSVFPLIEDANQLHEELTKIIKAIAEGHVSGPVTRVALVVQFAALCPNSIDANKLVVTIIPDQYRMRINDEEEFIFQINQSYMSRKVERDKIKMNSIKKWSVERFQILTITIPTSGALIPAPTGMTSTNLTSDFIAASVMLENNNAPVASLNVEEQSVLLLEALGVMAQTLRDIGLKIEGFEK